MSQSKQPYFSSASFSFLRTLERHNERAWFQRHKKDYEDQLLHPMLRLITDIQAPLREISPFFVANPRRQSGSMFRIYRDVRFSRDKRPYKEWVSARFYHQRTRELHGDAPCFYLHMQPDRCYIGGGIWHPGSQALKRIRNYLINNPASWRSITQSDRFRERFSFGGEKLVRPPRGYDPQHPLIDDLKRKDFIVNTVLPDTLLTDPDLLRQLIQDYRLMAPLVDWLCGALDLDF